MSASPSSHALLVLEGQRWHHQRAEDHDPRQLETQLAPWRLAISAARRSGHLVVFLQRDGEAGSPSEPLTRGWTLHPDFRVEENDLLLRVTQSNAFAFSSLAFELHARGVTSVELLALPGSQALSDTRAAAEQAGLHVKETWPA